jgi:DNA-binding HxlR family transcriptional regulator
MEPNSKPPPTQLLHAGCVALSILATPMNVDILQALEQGPKRPLALLKAIGSPPQSTMRHYSRMLSEQGIIERRRKKEFPGSTEYKLTPSGQGLLRVTGILERWLEMAPSGPIRLGTTASKSSTKALVEGWSTNIVRAIAARPLSLTQLSQLISKINYPALERRLAAMRSVELVAPLRGGHPSVPHVPTDWLRRSIVPMTAAAAWERQHQAAGAKPIGRLGVEAAFLLAIPLLRMPPTFSGNCRLAVELRGRDSSIAAGVLVRIEDGEVVFRSARLEGQQVEAWASGSIDLWIGSMSGREGYRLNLGGDPAMAEAVVDGLKTALTLSEPLNVDNP